MIRLAAESLPTKPSLPRAVGAVAHIVKLADGRGFSRSDLPESASGGPSPFLTTRIPLEGIFIALRLIQYGDAVAYRTPRLPSGATSRINRSHSKIYAPGLVLTFADSIGCGSQPLP